MSSNYNVLTKNRFAGLATDDESDGPTKQKQAQKTKSPLESKSGGQEPMKRTDIAKRQGQRPTQKSFTEEVPGNSRKPMTRSPPVAQASPEESKVVAADTDEGDMTDIQKKSVHPRRTTGQRFTREKTMNGQIRPNKRLYDRHSGMRRSKDVRKSGTSSANWETEVDGPTKEGTKEETNEEDPATELKKGNDKTTEAPPDRVVQTANYSEYQRSLQAKREKLLHHEMGEAQAMNGIAQHHNTETSNVDIAGYEKYEKQYDNAESPKQKGRKQKHIYDDMDNAGVEDDIPHRQKTYGLSEFTGRISARPRGVGRPRRANDQRQTQKPQKVEQAYPKYPVTLDLTDTAAFPTLTG